MVDLTLRIAILGFACFRLAQFLPYDQGPFSIFEKIRQRYGHMEFINCPYCQGIWMSLILTPFVFYSNPITDFIIFVFAIAGIQTMLQGRNVQ